MVARFVMKSNKKRILLVLAILTMAILLSCAFVACTKAETQDAQKKEITISFDTQGGSEITPITIRSGESLTLPKTPTKEGYVFDGWYLDSNCIEEYEDSYVVSKNITLYAKWRELVAGEEFNVIFNLNYGTDNIVEKTTENRLITYIPVRQGYRFNGWYYSDGYVEGIGYILTEKYDTTIPVTQNGLVLYAEWVDSSTDSRQLASPTISVNGTVLSWDAVKNAEKYELKFYLGKNLVKTYSTTQSSVNIDSIGIDAGTYTLKARSIGDGVSHINSAETIKHISYKVLLPVSNAKIDVESSVLTWNEANNAETYTVYIDGARFGRTYLNSLDLSKLNAGQYVIKIVAERAGYTSSNATFTLVKSRLLTPTIKIERQPNDNYSSKISWSAIYNANQYVVVVDKKEVATTSNNYYVLNDSDWGSNKKVSVSVYAKDSSADYLVSIPSEISTVTRTAKIAISHNIRNVSLVKVIGKSYSSTDNLIEDYSSADNFYVGVDFGEPKKVVAIPQNGYTWLGWYDKSGNLISTKTEYIFNAGTSSSEIVAHWASYSVALNKNDNNAGKIGFSVDDMSTQNTVSQRIVYGKEVTICASTNNGYTWLGWYKGDEKVSDEQTYTFTMSDSDLAYTAKWSKTTISVSSSSAGSVSGLSSTYKVGDKVTVTAVTNNGYTWDGWYLNGEKVSSDLQYEIQITEEPLNYVATWKYYTLTTSRNISAAGTVNSYWNQKVTVGDSVELVANTNKGYTWLGWYDGETLISLETTFTYEMPAESKTLIAKWTYYTLSTQTNNSEAGTYTALSDKKVTVGDSIELIASTNDGYTWLGWYDGETLISMETTYTYVMTAESKTFAAKWTYYTLSTQANDSEAGTYTVLSDKKVTVGDSIELVASTNKGYTWLGWYDGETMISSETTYTYVMPAENKTLIAKWTYYTLSTTNGNVDAGDITLLSYKKVAVGRSIDLIAVAKPGYSFVGWYDGEKMLSSDATYSYVMTSESKIITAKWNLITYRIVYSFSKDNVEFESDLPTSYTIGEESIILQELNNGNYYVDYWYYEGNEGKRIKIIDVEQKRDLSIVGHVASCGLALSETSVQGIGSFTQKDVLLPRYNGETEIVTIADNAFKNNTTINHVSIPYSITHVGSSAFYGCTGLMSVILGNSVTSIGSSAFYNCSRLVEIYNKSSLKIKIGDWNNGYIAYYAKNVYTEEGGNKLSTDKAGYVTYLDGEERILVAYNGTNTDLIIPSGITVIAEEVFKNRYDLTSVTIPDSVTSIGEGAFRGCSGLTSITIPDSVTSIGSDAFNGCNKLQDTYITDIAAWCNISGLYNLMGSGSSKMNLYINNELVTSITIPNGVTAIPSYAFIGCSGLTSVTIPDSVTSIGSYAFNNCKGLTSITIPDSVKSIGERAFYKCSGLTSVTIGNSVKSIGNYAFYGCTGLTSITIPNSVTSIGSYAFIGCTRLTSITIPDSVKSIGERAFEGTAWFNNQSYGLVYAGKVVYTYKGITPTSIVIKDGTLGIADDAFHGCSGLTSVTIPDSVTSIGSYAFNNCKGLTSITIPDSVKSIGERAFYDCSRLVEIYNKSSLKIKIGDWNNGYIAYYAKNVYTTEGGNKLATDENGYVIYTDGDEKILVAYHGTNTELILPSYITKINQYAFYNCSGLTSVTIPDSVTSIGNSAFGYCSGLTSVTIGNNVTRIVESAFYNCKGLTSITIPDSVTSIGNEAFYNTAWYNNQPDGLVYAGKVAYKYKGTMPSNTSIVLKEGTLGIASCAFRDCSGLTSITISDSVTIIGNSAFKGCSNLTSVTIGNNVTRIGSSAFYGCTRLTSITIPDSVTSIEGYAFYKCSGLTSVTIGNSVTSIGDYAFYNCSSLTSVTIGNSVTSIGSDAFYNCSKLTSVTIGNSVKSIGNYAFSDCRSLTSVTIPDSVTSIGGGAFSGCSKLQNIYITDIAAWCNISGLDNLMNYGSSNKNLYINNELATSVTIPDSVTSIGDYAFRNCSSLTSVTIPDSVTIIGGSAFSGCSKLQNIYITDIAAWCNISGLSKLMGYGSSNKNLYLNNELVTTLIIPDGVTAIPSNAFYGCSGLTSVTIPDSVTSIGDSAFSGCNNLQNIYITDIAVWFNISGLSNLMKYGASNKKLYINNELATSITIPNGVTAIPSNAFYGCSGLTSITIPDSVTSIGSYAFSGCTGLTSIIIPDSVTSIGERAFRDCSGLTSVTIGNSVTSIGSYAFSGCTELQNIYITDIAAWFNISGLDNLMLYGSNSKSIYLNNELITSVTIPEGMTTIPSYAFYNCSSLTSITIPDSVTNIGENALYNCNGLTRIDVSTNNTVYASVDGILYNKAKTEFIIIPKAIQGVVTIPSGVTNIGNWAFFNCNGLTSIFIPSGVNEIGEYTFYLCRNLMDVFIPNSVACIGQYAFYNCSKLERISFDGTTSQWENITKGGFWRYNTPSDCQIICDDPELEPMTEVKLEMPSNGYNIGWHWYQLPYVDNAFAYKFTFGNGDDDGIILNRSTLTFYDIPIDAKYIEYKALGGVLNGVRYLDSDSRRVDLAFWHYPVKYQSETYSVKKLLKKKLNLSEITSIKFGKLEEEHGESALSGTSFWRGRGGYLLIEGSDSNGVPKKLCYLMPGKYMSLGEMFDRIPGLVYYDELSVEAVNDTNRFELEDFKYYMQNEIIPHMQEHYPKYATFFNTCDMADYEITNYVGFGVYYSRYDHEAQIVSVDLKNAQGRTLHLELAMDMKYGSVENWKYVREHNMLFSQVAIVDPYMTEKLHSYWIYPTTYFDNDGDKSIKPNEEFNQKIIDTESNGIAYIYPSINYYLNGEEKDTLWDEHLSYLSIYPMPFLSKIKNKTYTFVTNCEQTIEPITGERYTVSLPKLTREGYVFCGWYDNEAFEGRAYFDTYGSSDKSTLYAKWLPKEEPPMPDGTSFEMAFIAQSGKTYDASITTSGQIVYFAFTPTADGTFTIQSIGSCDTYGNLYSSTKSLLATNDDGGTGNNFKLTYNMKAGTTYYVAIRLLYTSATGTFKVSFS